MPVLKLRTTSGQIADLSCTEIIEIDGKPFAAGDSLTELNERMAFLEGRVSALYELFTQPEEITLPAGAVPESFSISGV